MDNGTIKQAVLELMKKLNVDFNNWKLLAVALFHRSFSSQNQIPIDNERLEFLGDSILSACVSDILIRKLKKKKEGELTKIRAQLVSRYALRSRYLSITVDSLSGSHPAISSMISSSHSGRFHAGCGTV